MSNIYIFFLSFVNSLSGYFSSFFLSSFHILVNMLANNMNDDSNKLIDIRKNVCEEILMTNISNDWELIKNYFYLMINYFNFNFNFLSFNSYICLHIVHPIISLLLYLKLFLIKFQIKYKTTYWCTKNYYYTFSAHILHWQCTLFYIGL